MGYRELLQALEDEVGRQIRERRAEAEQQRLQLLETTRTEIAARRERALDEERSRLAGESLRALSKARLEQERAVLAEMRQQMAGLQAAAESRLPAADDPVLLGRLVDEVAPELGEGPVVFRVREGCQATLEDHLRRNHAGLLARSRIVVSPDARSGVEVLLGDRQRFDNTLLSRLRNAWQQLEPEIAARLFRAEIAAPRSRAPLPGEAVAARRG